MSVCVGIEEMCACMCVLRRCVCTEKVYVCVLRRGVCVCWWERKYKILYNRKIPQIANNSSHVYSIRNSLKCSPLFIFPREGGRVYLERCVPQLTFYMFPSTFISYTETSCFNSTDIREATPEWGHIPLAR